MRYKTKCTQPVRITITALIIGLLAGCGIPMRYTRDISSHEPMQDLSGKLDIPTGTAKKADSSFMVAFVEPTYEFDGANPQSPYLQMGQAYKKSDLAKRDYLTDLLKALHTDLDYILLQKGIRVLGTFKNLDEMTFDQKKRAVYAFTPTITISVSEDKTPTSGMAYSENGTFTVTGYITLLLRDTMTGEKLWIKRLDADPVRKPYVFTAKFRQPYGAASDVDLLLKSGVSEQDTSDKALVAALSEFYSALGKKLWNHIDPEEWEKYLGQVADIRKGKRF